MKIVIDIPEEAYELLKNEGVDWLGAEHILNAVANGIPLPKGHGRLIDADTLEESKEIMETIMNGYKYAVRMNEIRNAPTVVKADGGDVE